MRLVRDSIKAISDGAYKAQIVAVHGPDPGLASEITYDAITWDEPVSVSLAAAQPSNRRPSETHKIVPASVGDICWIVVRGGEAHLQAFESIYVGTCEEGQQLFADTVEALVRKALVQLGVTL